MNNRSFLYAILGELAYLVLRGWIRNHVESGIEQELYWTLLRVASIAFLLVLLRRRGSSASPGATPFPSADWIAAGLGLLVLAAPFAAGNVGASGVEALVFALTSFAVGFREELFYRAVLQGRLRGRLGFLAALVLSNLVFLFYHWGVQPFTPANIAMMFCTGCVLGAVYEATGSVLCIGLLHSVYDVAWIYSPYLPASCPEPVGAALSAFVACLLVWRVRRRAAKR